MTVQTVWWLFFSTERLWMKLTDRLIDRIGSGKQQTERLNERNGSGPKNKPSILTVYYASFRLNLRFYGSIVMEELKAALKKSLEDQKSLDSVSCQKSDEVRFVLK